MKQNKFKSILIKIVGTLALPVVLWIVFFLVCYAKGKGAYFASWEATSEILKKTCLGSVIAMGLSTQMLNGRFDFTGGITITLSAYIAAHVALDVTDNILLYVLVCVLVSVSMSLLTATVYRLFKMPIVITSIALTLVYEAMPRFLFDGVSTTLYSNPKLANITVFPIVYIILLAAIVVYFIFKEFSTAGTRARLLANNQMSAVNIGIDENKNLYVTYVVSGILFGLAAAIYGAQEWIQPGDIGNLSTTGVAFSYIVPVFIGMFIGFLSYGWIGVIVGAVSIQILSKGLTIITNGDSTGYYNIIFGIFMLAFWALTAEMGKMKKLINNIKNSFKRHKNKVEASN